MALALQDFTTMVKTQASAISVSCQQAIDMTVGSVVRALLEANASVGLWIQWLIVQVLSATRAATSVGSDLDTWVADFGMTRFAAVAASGSVRFSRITSGVTALIMPGVLVRTGLGVNDQIFQVIADISNPAWNGTGYLLASLDGQLTCPVIAQRTGASGNVVAGSVNVLASAIPGIDSVTNDLAMTGGIDAETDAALRTRFAGYLDSRNRATNQAIGFAIASVRQGVSYTIVDRVDASGAPRAGHFTVTVDDGTGTPSNDFIAEVAAAIDLVRPIGGSFSIRSPLIIPLTVQLSVTGPVSAQSSAQAAVIAYIASLPIGAALTLTRLYQIAYGSDVGITNVSGALINGAASDLTPPLYGLLRPSSVKVTS